MAAGVGVAADTVILFVTGVLQAYTARELNRLRKSTEGGIAAAANGQRGREGA